MAERFYHSYGEQLGSLPVRFAKWMLKLLIAYAAVTGAVAWTLHRSYSDRTAAAWRAFWAEPATCAVPASPGAPARGAQAVSTRAAPVVADVEAGAVLRATGKRGRRTEPSGAEVAPPARAETAAPDGSPAPAAKASAPTDASRAAAPALQVEKPEVVIYGRGACGLTRHMRDALNEAGVPFRFAVVDEPSVHREVTDKLRGIGHQGGFGLPVVAVGSKTFIRPAVQEVLTAHRSFDFTSRP